MLNPLGPHSNAHVLYPIGTSMGDSQRDFVPFISNDRPATVFFAGSLSFWYGPMLELACASRFRLSFTFRNFRQPRPRQLERGALTPLHEQLVCTGPGLL